jgi:hypothetical protein
MRRFDSGPVIRQRMLRLKKRKNVLRRQQSLREKMLLSNHESEDLLTDIQEPSAGTESATGQDQ